MFRNIIIVILFVLFLKFVGNTIDVFAVNETNKIEICNQADKKLADGFIIFMLQMLDKNYDYDEEMYFAVVYALEDQDDTKCQAVYSIMESFYDAMTTYFLVMWYEDFNPPEFEYGMIVQINRHLEDAVETYNLVDWGK